MDSYEVNEKKGERESREDEVRKVLLLNVETLTRILRLRQTPADPLLQPL